jgi:hypothetical protein
VPAESPFPLIDVTDWTWTLSEPMGKPGKRWLTDLRGRSWLWKPVTMQREATTTFPKGDDWSEKLAAEVARLVGIPAAEAELAWRDSEAGVILGNLVPSDGELVHGNELLAAVVEGYSRDLRQEVPGYTVEGIASALELASVAAPDGAPSELDAFGVFVEYLALDAMIGNTDRHHSNWGVIRGADGGQTLCPSYDHATSLGFQLSDARRLRDLDEAGGVARYAERARSRPFQGRPSLIALFADGLRLRPDAADLLVPALERLDAGNIALLVESVPAGRMSQPSRRFVLEMLTTNRRRILDACR